jgi:hypothetical protein
MHARTPGDDPRRGWIGRLSWSANACTNHRDANSDAVIVSLVCKPHDSNSSTLYGSSHGSPNRGAKRCPDCITDNIADVSSDTKSHERAICSPHNGTTDLCAHRSGSLLQRCAGGPSVRRQCTQVWPSCRVRSLPSHLRSLHARAVDCTDGINGIPNCRTDGAHGVTNQRAHGSDGLAHRYSHHVAYGRTYDIAHGRADCGAHVGANIHAHGSACCVDGVAGCCTHERTSRWHERTHVANSCTFCDANSSAQPVTHSVANVDSHARTHGSAHRGTFDVTSCVAHRRAHGRTHNARAIVDAVGSAKCNANSRAYDSAHDVAGCGTDNHTDHATVGISDRVYNHLGPDNIPCRDPDTHSNKRAVGLTHDIFANAGAHSIAFSVSNGSSNDIAVASSHDSVANGRAHVITRRFTHRRSHFSPLCTHDTCAHDPPRVLWSV